MTRQEAARRRGLAHSLRGAFAAVLHTTLLVALLATPLLAAAASVLDVIFDSDPSVEGLRGVAALAVSPDGQLVLAVSPTDNSLTSFRFDASAEQLAFLDAAIDGNGSFGLDGAAGVSVSPDSRFVFVVADQDDSLVAFRRDFGDNSLMLTDLVEQGVGGSDGLDGAQAVAVHPSGELVFVSARDGNAVSAYRMDASREELSFSDVARNGLGGVSGLLSPGGLALSPDGRSLYVAARASNSVAAFRLDGSQDALAFVASYRDGLGGVEGLRGVADVAVSPDGRHVYAVSVQDATIVRFNRSLVTGRLRFAEANEVLPPNLGAGGRSIEVTSDGQQVLVGGLLNDTVLFSSRNASSGEVTFVDTLSEGDPGVNGFQGLWDIVASPDARHAFTAARNDGAVSLLDVSSVRVIQEP